MRASTFHNNMEYNPSSKCGVQKANLDDAAEAALTQKPQEEQVMEGAVYKKTAVKAEVGGRGQNPMFGVFTRKK